MANAPSAEKILSTLVELLADQYGVKVTYEILERNEMSNENQHTEQQTPSSAGFAKRKSDARSVRHVGNVGGKAQCQYAQAGQ